MNRRTPAEALDAPNVAAFPAQGFDQAFIDEVNERHALVLIGSRAVVIKENGPDAPVGERLQILSVEAFQHWYRNRTFRVGDKWKSLGELWMSSADRRQFHGMEFAPSPDDSGGREGYYNLWRGFEVEPDPSGDCKPFIDHMFDNVCSGNAEHFEWMMSWFASIFQRPQERIGTSLVLRGPMGAGKSMPGEIIGSLIAPHYFLVDEPRYLVGNFNSHLASCLLLQADEAVWAGDKQAEGRLKGMVTASHQMIEHKGIDPIRVRNHVRLMMTSNEAWVIPAGRDERRFAVFDVGAQRAQDRTYFGALARHMATPGAKAALLYELLNWKLDEAVLRSIPATEALLDQKLRSGDSVEQWWYEVLDHGEVRPGHGWPRWMITRLIHKNYRLWCERYNIRRPLDERSFMKALKKLCPGFVKRRAGRDDVVADHDDDGHGTGYGTGETDPATRPWGHDFPPLADARTWFEDAYRQPVGWDAEGV